MPEKNPEVKGRPNPVEKKPHETNDASKRALGAIALNGAQKK